MSCKMLVCYRFLFLKFQDNGEFSTHIRVRLPVWEIRKGQMSQSFGSLELISYLTVFSFLTHSQLQYALCSDLVIITYVL